MEKALGRAPFLLVLSWCDYVRLVLIVLTCKTLFLMKATEKQIKLLNKSSQNNPSTRPAIFYSRTALQKISIPANAGPVF